MNFAVKMLEMLTSAYNRTDILRLREGEKPKTNIGKMFTLAGWGFDVIREQTEKVHLWDDIDQMKGAALDRFGKNFGVVRGEAGDEIMKIMVKVKIIAMLAAGNLDTIIFSAATLFGVEPEDVRYEEVYPAKVFLYIDEDKLDEEHKNVADVIAGLMTRIKSAGIGIRIFYKTYHGEKKNLRLAVISTQMVFRIRATPVSTNEYITANIQINQGIPTMLRVESVFVPDQGNKKFNAETQAIMNSAASTHIRLSYMPEIKAKEAK